ncbi:MULTISPECIES: hypothetical protein [Ralstonia]|jgi:uncharacterized protein YbjQ (UPF0145 family)|uniref:Uncharacterized protein n=1 Tax=Ralstonia mannitolilytica TaxID=105219 RepID=A0AAJ4ZQ76_9RALS|nr:MULTISPECIES: hypothetical protein [Ralstonia]ATG22137.1 hypothetical protein CO705_19735 [Ralstonia pickettii]AJW46657.1 signal peptide protein [Ralstonia mannitolilytica]MBU9576926.1 hypothetical protein [Ralstonia mannitolilytica]PLT17902.1 hypothetical protein CXP34_15030 [Ralstonia mannitolilytica]QIF10012.1 hypothetical protein G5A69_21240 [Ralstonia mannitolilytica]
MKTQLLLAACAAMLAQAAHARTEVMTYPLQPVLQSQQFAPGVALYFGNQPHPAVVNTFGEVTKSSHPARKTATEVEICNATLADALRQLANAAHDRGANAVINIKTWFHSTVSNDPSNYTCGVSGVSAALRVSGELVTVEASK